MRDAVGKDMQLRMDANMQCTVDQALALCRAVKSCDMQLFEQPTPKDDLAGLARVRREGGIPIMADESIESVEDAFSLAAAGAASIFALKIAKNGGPRAVLRRHLRADAPRVLVHGRTDARRGAPRHAPDCRLRRHVKEKPKAVKLQ